MQNPQALNSQRTTELQIGPVLENTLRFVGTISHCHSKEPYGMMLAFLQAATI